MGGRTLLMDRGTASRATALAMSTQGEARGRIAPSNKKGSGGGPSHVFLIVERDEQRARTYARAVAELGRAVVAVSTGHASEVIDAGGVAGLVLDAGIALDAGKPILARVSVMRPVVPVLLVGSYPGLTGPAGLDAAPVALPDLLLWVPEASASRHIRAVFSFLDPFTRRMDRAARACSERYSLTKRQGQILGAMVAGDTREAIAVELDLSEQTVKTHERNLREKTGHSSSPQLVIDVLRDAVEGCVSRCERGR
jgi:DNA-binding CsgD family transcriptional regulator